MNKLEVFICILGSSFTLSCQQRKSPQLAADLTQAKENQPLGNSIFAQLVDSWDGKVPTPFSSLIYELRDTYQATLHSQLFPKGRSLQRDYSDFANPRVLVSYSGSKSGHNSINEAIDNRLFISYVKNNDQLEVLSYNDHKGQYDFFIVDQYLEGSPTSTQAIVKEDRFTCVVCHQNEGPIFSEEDWSESNSGDDTIRKLARVHKISEYDRKKLYEGVPIISTFILSNRYDETTDIGNGFLGMQSFWQESCPNDETIRQRCRRLMLALGVESAWNGQSKIFVPIDSQGAYWTELWALWQRHWPKDGIKFHLSHLNEFMFDPSSEEIPAFAAPENNRDPIKIFADKPYERLFTGGYLREEDIVYKPNIFFGWFRFLFTQPDVEQLKARHKTLEEIQQFILNSPSLEPLVQQEVLSRRLLLEYLSR